MKKMLILIAVWTTAILTGYGARTVPPDALESGSKYRYSHSTLFMRESVLLEVNEDAVVMKQIVSTEIHDQFSESIKEYMFAQCEKENCSQEYTLSNGVCRHYCSGRSEDSLDYTGKIVFGEDGTIELTIDSVDDIQGIHMKYYC